MGSNQHTSLEIGNSCPPFKHWVPNFQDCLAAGQLTHLPFPCRTENNVVKKGLVSEWSMSVPFIVCLPISFDGVETTRGRFGESY